MKPTPEQVCKWDDVAISYADKEVGPFVNDYRWHNARNGKLAELAAAWGAEQAQQTKAELPDDEPKDAEWDKVDPAFKEWWNAEYNGTTNPFRIDSLAYWSWAAWKAAKEKRPTVEASELPKSVAYRKWNGDEGCWHYSDGSCAKKNDELLYTAAQMHDHFAAGYRAGAAGSQDAKRYRWLRDVGDRTWIPLKNRWLNEHYSKQCEDYIDASMQGDKQ